jgi:hypothetical protein
MIRSGSQAMAEALVQVRAPHFCAGLVVVGNRCTEAAPILRKACLGKSRQQLQNYFIRRGWKAVIVPTFAVDGRIVSA